MLRGLLWLWAMRGLPRLVTRLMLDSRVPFGLKLIPLAAIVYLIWPIDFLPDMLPVLGRIDDILVLLVALGLFLALVPQEIVTEHIRRSKGNNTAAHPDAGARRNVIDGTYRFVDDGE